MLSGVGKKNLPQRAINLLAQVDWADADVSRAQQQAVAFDSNQNLLAARVDELRAPLRRSRDGFARVLPSESFILSFYFTSLFENCSCLLFFFINKFLSCHLGMQAYLKTCVDKLRSLQWATDRTRSLVLEAELLNKVKASSHHLAELAQLYQEEDRCMVNVAGKSAYVELCSFS